MKMREVPFSELLGKTLKGVDISEDIIKFTLHSNEVYQMLHRYSCCESVYVDDICGNITDLLNNEILLAEEVSNSDDDPTDGRYVEDSFTWTFYKLSTIAGSVTIRWFGTSNGYYSESVSFEKGFTNVSFP